MTTDHGADEILSEVTADEHFATVPEWVIFHAELCGNAVRLYCVMRRFADQKGVAFPGLSTIGDKYGVSHDSVTRHMNKLIKVGAVTKKRRLDPKTGKATSNLYVVHSRPKFIDVKHDFTPAPGKGIPSASAETADVADEALFPAEDIAGALDAITACDLCDSAGHVLGTRTDCTHEKPRKRAKRKRDDAETNAAKLSALHAAHYEPEVHELLTYLADVVEGNGSRRPAFDAVDYARAAELLEHERTRPEGAHGAEMRIRQVIDWTQTDTHWQPIILTAGKLHEHYDTIRLKTASAYKVKAAGGASGGRRPLDRRREILDGELARIRQEEAMKAQGPTGSPAVIDVAPLERLRQLTSG